MDGPHQGVSAVRVDDVGVFASSPDEVIFDVLFDQRRIFSFWLHRDGEPVDAGHLVRWPRTLREFLDGVTRVTLQVHGTQQVVYDQEVTLGAGGGRIAVVSATGAPLALDKSLRRVQTFDTRSAEHIEPLLDAIEDVLDALLGEGIDAFLAYGTALGAVRDGRLIGHDSDADLGYVSRFAHPVDVMRESFALQRALVRRGYPVTRYSGAAFKVDVRESDGSLRGLDVFGGFMYDGRLHLMGEIRTPFRGEWLFPLGRATLEGRALPVPADPDRFLAATYGESWRVPDPAFHFDTPMSTHRRLNGWFRGTRIARTVWDQEYARHAVPRDRPSDLVRWLRGREGQVDRFVDIGCGHGTDARWMARKGAHAVGLDFVPRAFASTAQACRAEGLDAEYYQFNLLELRSVLATSAYIACQPGPRVVMARHLADGLVPAGRQALWRASDMMLRGGGRMYLEFLTHDGGDGYARRHHVQPLEAGLVAAEAEAAGAAILHREVVTTDRGDDRGKSPSSQICRMVVQWAR